MELVKGVEVKLHFIVPVYIENVVTILIFNKSNVCMACVFHGLVLFGNV